VKSVRHFGCSVIGPGNLKRHNPCQDAWAYRSWKNSDGKITSAIAIADGMGSKPHAHVGAKAAVSVALQAARRWGGNTYLNSSWLTRWIEAEWRHAIGDRNPRECCTTCLLAVHTPRKGIIMGGLGDGLALFSENTKMRLSLSGRRENDFGNQSLALGAPHRVSDWQFEEILNLPGQWMVTLTTDGVSDDIQPSKMHEFTAWLESLKILKQPESSLRRSLRNWPTKGHTDDKTIATLFKNSNHG